VITGDTLMAGGPGKTWAAGELEVLLQTLVDRLLHLPDDLVVLPGHGDDTTIGAARKGHAEYLKHPKPPGYFGDVTWAS